MKKVLLTIWLLLIAGGIFSLFWYHEWKYALPTPVPQNYDPAKIGAHINIEGKVASISNQPVFIHFFNPDCPCSRFNIEHFNSLVKKYGEQISFSVVVISKTKDLTAEALKDKYNITVPISFDASIATECGVYSTPQAVLLDNTHKLYYRGNYNRSRYCSDKNSNYAQMAIDSLMANDPHPLFSQFALKPYGCQLTTCTK